MWLSGWEGWDPKKAPWWHPKHGSEEPVKSSGPWSGGMNVPKQPKKPEPHPDEEIADREAAKLFEWRFDYFKRMGFDASDAELLAESRADTHEVEQALEMGCTIELARSIFL